MSHLWQYSQVQPLVSYTVYYSSPARSISGLHELLPRLLVQLFLYGIMVSLLVLGFRRRDWIVTYIVPFPREFITVPRHLHRTHESAGHTSIVRSTDDTVSSRQFEAPLLLRDGSSTYQSGASSPRVNLGILQYWNDNSTDRCAQGMLTVSIQHTNFLHDDSNVVLPYAAP